MNSIRSAGPATPASHRLPPAKAGMLAFLLSEVAFFSTLITTYVVFLRETKASIPGPAEVFHLPLVLTATACLLSSSFTLHLGERACHGNRRSAFLFWWGLTILLGATFLACTAKEWWELINHFGLTISRNLFGSCYFTLVGFHAAHVTVGLVVLSIVFLLGAEKDRRRQCDDGRCRLLVLAFRRWRMGRCVFACLFDRTIIG